MLYTSPNSSPIFNEVEDLSMYKYKITYILKRPILVVAPFVYENSNDYAEYEQQLKLNYFYNNILTIEKKKGEVNWNNRVYVVTNLILNRFNLQKDVDGLIYQSVETFKKNGMKNGLTISNNIDPYVADTNLALFSDSLVKVKEIAKSPVDNI